MTVIDSPGLVALHLVFGAVGVRVDASDLSGRTLLRSVMYLVQVLGIDFGYKFFWSSHGPECLDLNQHLHELQSRLTWDRAFGRDQSLRSEVYKICAKVKELLAGPGSNGLSQSAWACLLASTHYLTVDNEPTVLAARDAVERLGMETVQTQ